MDPDDKQILLMLAWLFLQHGQINKADILCSEIQEQDPGDPASAAILANLRIQNAQPQEALDVLAKAKFPASMERAICLLKGRAFNDLGEPQKAHQIWQDFLQHAHSPQND